MARLCLNRGNGGEVIRRGAVLLFLILCSACATPISLSQQDPQSVYQDLTRNALSAGQASRFSEIILNRANLADKYQSDPEAALVDLHVWVAKTGVDRDPMFALAELSFLHAQRTQQRKFYVAAVVYAYAFLFPPGGTPALDPLDPRDRVACDLYNQALTAALRAADGQHEKIAGGRLPLPLGEVTVGFTDDQLRWVDRRLSDFVPIGEFKVTGLRNTYRQAGVGAALAASAATDRPPTGLFVSATLKVPVTAFLRFDDPWRYFRSGELQARLELYLTQEVDTVAIGSRAYPLEAAPTATLAYMLSASRVWDLEYQGFLFGDLLHPYTTTQLIAIDPYRRGRIPVVFIHGTASSPARWAEMFNELQNDPRIRDRYQFWFFAYETGNPMLYSAMRLREALRTALATLDPGGTDAALRQMVLIGHSQGGLLAKLMVVNLEDQVYATAAPEGLGGLVVSDATRQTLEQIFAVRPLPFVRQVIFLATPQHGSYVAGNWLAQQIARLIRLPGRLVTLLAEAGSQLPQLQLTLRGQYASVYGMTPGSPLITLLAPAPLAPGVAGHSIIAVNDHEPLDQATDGVVTYRSAHLDGMASEEIVQSGHSVQDNPDAIEGVRRILLADAANPTPVPDSGGRAPAASSEKDDGGLPSSKTSSRPPQGRVTVSAAAP